MAVGKGRDYSVICCTADLNRDFVIHHLVGHFRDWFGLADDQYCEPELEDEQTRIAARLGIDAWPHILPTKRLNRRDWRGSAGDTGELALTNESEARGLIVSSITNQKENLPLKLVDRTVTQDRNASFAIDFAFGIVLSLVMGVGVAALSLTLGRLVIVCLALAAFAYALHQSRTRMERATTTVTP